MEESIKIPKGVQLNRKGLKSVVIWSRESSYKEAIWKSKALEAITSEKAPFVQGGHGSFWPIPLLREGPTTTRVWKAVLPEGYTEKWLDYMGVVLTEELGGKFFWTMSKRYDLTITMT